jgi:hypothetical protein
MKKGTRGFDFAPRCPYNKEFTASFANGTALPNWISFDITRDFNQWFAINLTDTKYKDEILDMQV